MTIDLTREEEINHTFQVTIKLNNVSKEQLEELYRLHDCDLNVKLFNFSND